MEVARNLTQIMGDMQHQVRDSRALAEALNDTIRAGQRAEYDSGSEADLEGATHFPIETGISVKSTHDHILNEPP